ncbi:MAG: helix-turn-helix domain-containing protein [Christensenellaceae bacterium]|jgi:transcriptional regulator with XRE-family HTH domain|nr:helix-turn-helix domain-containing protein [Christensenellaceae bacterium]
MLDGNNVKLAREKMGLTQRELASRIGVSVRSVQAYECLGSLPRGKRLDLLASVLNVSISYLYGEDADSVDEGKKQFRFNGDMLADNLLQSATFIFSGGSLSDANKDALMHALQDVYWDSKKDNRKYAPKKQ